MSRIVSIVLLALLTGTAALAQYMYDPSWNATGPKPLYCMFNGEKFYAADEVCVGNGVKQTCGADGTFSAPASETSCTGPAAPSRSYSTGLPPHGVALCAFGREKFSVGALVCAGPGAKQICQTDGTLAASVPETACHGAVASVER